MKKINPLTLLITWIVGSSVLALIVAIILGVNSPGGEQKPLIFLSKFIYIIIYGTLILSILSIPLFVKWSKKYWIIQALFIGICIFCIYVGNKNTIETKYTTISVDTIIGNRKYTKCYEYYDYQTLRSISFFYNNKKDSIWTTY